MENDRILLRPWLESDAPALFKYASDPDVGPRAGWPPHKNMEERKETGSPSAPRATGRPASAVFLPGRERGIDLDQGRDTPIRVLRLEL